MSAIGPSIEQCVGLRVVRVARHPDPLAFIPLPAQTWSGRFDDPDRLRRTLDTATDVYGAWVEVLGRFRAHVPTRQALGAIRSEPGDIEPDARRTIAPGWLASRSVARAKVSARVAHIDADRTLRWLELRPRLREVLAQRGIRAVDVSVVTGPDRHLTQALAGELRLAAEAQAVSYPSRFGTPNRCVAIFEPIRGAPRIEPLDEASRADPMAASFRAAMMLHGLSWSG